MFDIEPATGLVCFEEDDFSLSGENSFFFTRRYSNLSGYQGSFGVGWTYPYETYLTYHNGELCLLDGEGRQIDLPGLVRRSRIEIPTEDLIAESVDSEFLLHQGEGKTLTFSKMYLPNGRFPLVRVDQTDENSVFLSYTNGCLEEIRTTSFHRLGLEYRGAHIESIFLRRDDDNDIALATYDYSPSGQLISVRDALNGSRTYEYVGDLLIRYTNRMGGSYYLEYDRQQRATAVWQDGLSRQRRVKYDDKKRARLVTDSLGYSTLLRYNENDLLMEATLFDGSRVERAYANGNEPIAVTGTGPQPLCQYDPVTNVVEEIDPDGSVSRFKYDDRNRVIEEIDPDGGATRYEYDEHNRITRQVDPLGGVNALTFNANGNLVQHVQPLGNTVRATRFNTGRMELEDNLGPLHVSEHDVFGNTTQITTPSGRTTVFERDLFGRLTALNTNGATARKWYDSNGERVAETDLAGGRTTYERDSFGLLLAWTNPLGRRIEYVYDAERRLIGARSSDGIECSYSYDTRGRLTHMKLRDGREETISYDENGLRSIFSDSGGLVTKYTYTPGGQLARIEAPTGTVRYEYDAGGNCTFTECDGHTVAREWAPGERLLSEEQDGFRIEYEHNLAGRVVLRTDSTGRVTRYRYDVRGQLADITDSLFGDFEVHRDRIGSKVEERLPNGLVRKFEYSIDDEIARVVTRNPVGQIVCERAYRHAPNGELIEAETEGGERLQFQYDAAYQLITVAGAAGESETFAYDLDHNIIYYSRRGDYHYDGGHVIRAGDIGYEYDDSGRIAAKLQSEQVTSFTYSLGGLIREAVLPDDTHCRYEYDGFGRRVLKVGPGFRIRYYWDQDVLLYEEHETPQGKSNISYLFIPDTFFPVGHAVNGACFYYELDQRSLIREVYDATGVTVGRFAYWAYGERRTLELGSPPADPPFRLLGQIWDEETGLHYNRFRYYDADIGRYLSPDLSIHQVEHNSYSYSPNPIRWADPLGLMARFSTSDALSFVEESANKDGFFECSGCGFKNKNRVFARSAESGRPVGDGAFQAGHKKAHAKGGSANIRRNAKVEGGTCNCSKGKGKESGLT